MHRGAARRGPALRAPLTARQPKQAPALPTTPPGSYVLVGT